jgi:hypothetical protein
VRQSAEVSAPLLAEKRGKGRISRPQECQAVTPCISLLWDDAEFSVLLPSVVVSDSRAGPGEGMMKVLTDEELPHVNTIGVILNRLGYKKLSQNPVFPLVFKAIRGVLR